MNGRPSVILGTPAPESSGDGRRSPGVMSVESVLARIAEISGAPQTRAPQPAPATGGSFASVLAGQSVANVPFAGTAAAMPVGWTAGGGSAGLRALQAAQGEVGQAEMPPGSNDSPRLAMYRQATAGSGVGPWCAYFVSWAAAQAGAPVGEAGQGFGSVDALYAWAQRTGRAMPAAAGARPNAGDLIVWDEHVGIVESVDPDGTIHTIEGNSSDQVSQRTYGSDGGGAVGYVRLG
jgi:CHAP domain-containing protein